MTDPRVAQPRKKKRKNRLPLLILLTLLLVGVTALVLFVVTKKDGPVLVSVEPVSRHTITQTVSAIGKINPEYQVKISSEASGEIIYLGVRDGDTVSSGQLLVRIQPDIVQTQVDQFRAGTDAAKSLIAVQDAEVERTQANLKRIEDLYQKNFASREEFDQATAQYRSAVNRLASAKADYIRSQGALKQTVASASRTTIAAPMSGVVTYLAVEKGEKVVGTAQMQGTEIMRIADLNIINAWVDVDENDVALISLGDTARIRVDALKDEVFRGVVYEVGHSARIAAQGTQNEVVSFQVKIRLVDKSPKLRPGMSCSVDIETETHANVLAVPIQAVSVRQDAGLQSDLVDTKKATKRGDDRTQDSRPPSIVWVTNGTSVRQRTVQTGISDAGFIEIISGLKDKDRVVVGPYQAVSKLLKDGQAVKIENAKSRKERFKAMREQ
ncbi:MAG: efflux RND transporter periplasmic adaptor subunit [Candidatus Kapabacteria bacterium]|nr:efflux RND transporter periplasmic adaptor subunit [Candidatus Kapabacteria bacterium]